jgi:hypothetical protein
MRLIWLTIWSWLIAGSSTCAAEEKPFMSFYNPPVWEIPGIEHDLPPLAAWLGIDGLQFAARHFAPAMLPHYYNLGQYPALTRMLYRGDVRESQFK